MKIVVLASSPHKNGTPNTLVNEFTYDVIDKYFDTLFSYMHFEDIGRIYAKGLRTISMIPKKYYEEAYKLGRDI